MYLNFLLVSLQFLFLFRIAIRVVVAIYCLSTSFAITYRLQILTIAHIIYIFQTLLETHQVLLDFRFYVA